MSREHSEVTIMSRLVFVTGQNRDIFVTLLESTFVVFAKGVVAVVLNIRGVVVNEVDSNNGKSQKIILFFKIHLLFDFSGFFLGSGADFDFAD